MTPAHTHAAAGAQKRINIASAADPSKPIVSDSTDYTLGSSKSSGNGLLPPPKNSSLAPAPPHLALKQPSRPSPFRLRRDYRQSLPTWLSRFIGYRSPSLQPPFPPLDIFPFNRLTAIPLKFEVWIFGWFGSFIGILLVESLMTTTTAFRDIFHAPIIVASFGATAVLIYGTVDSPLSQPRNLLGGHVISAIIGVSLTRLFCLHDAYPTYLEQSPTNSEFHVLPFLNGGLSMSIALAAMFLTGTVHPPGGATALIAAIEPAAVKLSWRFIPVILVSALVMLGWALLINNIGRRRYPLYWWEPQRCFVVESTALEPDGGEEEEEAIATGRENPLRIAEDGGRTAEAMRMERLAGWGGSDADLERALSRASRRSGLIGGGGGGGRKG